MILAIIGLAIGLVIVAICPIAAPLMSTRLLAVALLAALDSVFGGLRSVKEKKFDTTIFITGFFSNAILAALLVFIGDRLGLDLYYVALLTFGFRVFQNLAIIRRALIKKD